MKNIYLKAALMFGVMIGVPLSVLGVCLAITKGRTYIFLGIAVGMILGLIGGILFGLFMALFVKCQTIMFKRKRKEIAKEYDIIYDDAANHFVGKEGVGGWLFLTRDRLIFMSHNFNLQNHNSTIPLHTIKSITMCNFLFIFNTGLLIEMNDNVIEKFAVNSPSKWVEVIEQSKKNLVSLNE